MFESRARGSFLVVIFATLSIGMHKCISDYPVQFEWISLNSLHKNAKQVEISQ